MKKKVLYITRKYPPQVGGMENFSYYLYTGLKQNQKIDIDLICLPKKQTHLIWFLPYTCLYVLFNARKYDVLFIGDAVLCILGIISKVVSSKTKRCINVFGLDITYKNILYQFYLKLFYKKSSDLFISISEGTNQLLHQRGDFSSVIITPGVDSNKIELQTFSKEEFIEKYKLSSYGLVLITVGRLVKRKGVQWFIENVLSRWSNCEIHYFIIGDGEERKTIQESIERSGLENRVTMLGKVSQKILDEFYRNADIFVMPNIPVPGDTEGFGIVAVEASLSGLLVVASGLEGICDAIVDGKNGVLVEAENAEAYIERLTSIIEKWPKYDQLRKEYAAYTREHYSWEKICSMYVEIFENL